MHEARLCLSILRLAEEALTRDGGQQIVQVELEVGEFSGVAPEALAATGGRELVLRAMEVT
jgi:Zn finger protein HypA/HybF involved in hydrogenase expression